MYKEFLEQSDKNFRNEEFYKKELNEKLKQERIDITLPGKFTPQGKVHLLTSTTNEIVSIFQSLGFSAENPLSRAFARVRKKGIPECRSLQAARAFALLAALSLHLAFDHQMTPPLFAGAFRAFGPFAPLTSARLSGTPSAALRPKASSLSGLGDELSRVERNAACPVGELRAED